MYLPVVTLHESASLEQAAELMARHGPGARLLAGGTDLLVDLKTGRIQADHLISIGRIPELHGISQTPDGLRIGTLTTIAELLADPIIQQQFAPIIDAAAEMAAPQVRNAATVGGNIASAVPCADLPPILMVLGASVALWSPDGQRRVALDAFFRGPRQTVRREDEVLTAVEVPFAPPSFGAAYARLSLREGNAIAVAGVAAGLHFDDGGIIREARLALGAVAPVPTLVEAAGQALAGKPLDEATITEAADLAVQAAQPITDVRGSADYRRDMVGVLTRRALEKARQRALERTR
ncbi:MAG: xanthine dehydrogenase family protein subunit M [bacterium]|nr:xanthine dehydrogenase family protein subunit M [bacterium]